MLDKFRLTIGCIFESAANASAAGFSFFANSVNLCTPFCRLFFCVASAKFSCFNALRLFCTLAFLGCENFARTLNGIVRVGETSGILTVFTVAAVFAIALFLTATQATFSAEPVAAERALPGAIWPGSLYIANPT